MVGLTVNGVIPTRNNELLFPWAYESVIAGTWVTTTALAFCTSSAHNATTHANGDGLQFYRELYGNYTLRLCATKNTTNGILKLYVDGVETASWDTYAAGLTSAYRFAGQDVAIGSGRHELELKVVGKNGASSDYIVEIFFLQFEPK